VDLGDNLGIKKNKKKNRNKNFYSKLDLGKINFYQYNLMLNYLLSNDFVVNVRVNFYKYGKTFLLVLTF